MKRHLDQGQESIEDGVRSQFNRQAACYGRSHTLANTSDVESAIAGVSFGKRLRVLDVACGGGHCAVFSAKRGWDVIACDLASEMLKATTKLAEEEGVNVRTILATAECLPFENGSFDLVTCRVAAHHFRDIIQFLSEAYRVLVPGGCLLVIDGVSPSDSPEASNWVNEVEKLRDPSHGRFLSVEEWQELVEQTGFIIELLKRNRLLQSDLVRYFDIAATSSENRQHVLTLVKNASDEVRRVMQLEENHGIISWWCPRMILRAVSRK